MCHIYDKGIDHHYHKYHPLHRDFNRIFHSFNFIAKFFGCIYFGTNFFL